MAIAKVARAASVPGTQARTGIWRSTLLALGLCLVVFLLVQGLLAATSIRDAHDAVGNGAVRDSVFLRSLPVRARGDVLAGALAYLGIAIAGVAIARQGHRRLFLVPAAIFVLGAAVGDGHAPQAIGLEWILRAACLTGDPCAGSWLAHPWTGPLIDLVIVLVPGWFMSRSVEPRAWPRDSSSATWAAIGSVIGCLAAATWAIGTQRPVEVAVFASAATAGLLIGVAKPWWPWLPVEFSLAVAGATVPLVGSFMRMSMSSGWVLSEFAMEVALPVVAVGVVATLWEPLARVGGRLQAKPLQLLIAVNALNVADAVLTAVAVNAGAATEANPFVRMLGLPGKIVLVGLVTFALYKRRPSALVWPAAALLAVVAYHLAGAIVNS
jgi:hypothetical protein